MAQPSGWQNSSPHLQNVTVNLNHSTWGNKAQKRKWPQVPLSASRYKPPPETRENPGEKQELAIPSRAQHPRKSASSRVTGVFGCVKSSL